MKAIPHARLALQSGFCPEGLSSPAACALLLHTGPGASAEPVLGGPARGGSVWGLLALRPPQCCSKLYAGASLSAHSEVFIKGGSS